MSNPALINTHTADILRELESDITGLNRLRRGDLVFVIITTFILGLVTLPLSYIAVTSLFISPQDPRAFSVIAYLAPVCLFVLTAPYITFDMHFRKRAKRLLFRKIAARFKITYIPNGCFPLPQISDHYILPSYGFHRSEDGLSFVYNARKVEAQESTMYYQRPEDSIVPLNIRKERGLLIRLNIRKKQDFHTVMLPRKWFGGWLYKNRFLGMGHYQPVPFNNPALKKGYTILSERPADAHYLFDPLFIERVIHFEKLLGARNMTISFQKNECIIYARFAHNFFEPGHLLQPVSEKSVRKVISEIMALEEILEALKLNPYVGI